MLDPQEIFLQSTDPVSERIAHIYEIYSKELRKANALDFDDLLLEAVRLLRSSGEVRERYNRRYRYLLIDEYQDTNRPQYELMKLLAGPEHNVCVVGDEDQSIYSWRGADIRNILEFEQDFPEAKTIRLEQNYRSTQRDSRGSLGGGGAQPAAQRQERSGPRARAEPRSAITKRPTERMKRSLPPTTSRNICAGRAGAGSAPRRRALSHQLRSPVWWKRRCAATESHTPWWAASLFTSEPRSRICCAICRLVRESA